MADSRGPWLSSAMALFLVWTALMLLVRIWAKLKSKSWGLDDWTISGAFVVAVMHVGATFWAIKWGYGLPVGSIPQPALDQVTRSLYASQSFYIISTGLSKVSTALFIVHLSHSSGPLLRPAHAVAAVAILWTITSLFIVAFRGKISRPWATLDGTQPMFARWIGVEVPGLVLELALWALSINLVWRLQMTLRKRLTIVGAFGFRLFLIPIVAVRLFYLSPKRNPDPTFSSIVPNIMTEGVLQFSIISASITSLRPFLRSLHPGYAVNSNGTQKSGHRSTNRSGSQDPYYRLDVVSKRDKYGATGTPGAHLRPLGGLSEGHAIAYPAKPRLRKEDAQDIEPGWSANKGKLDSSKSLTEDTDSIDAAVPDPGVIRKTTDWAIRYEND